MEECRKRKEKGESVFFLLKMLCFICFFNLEHVSSWYPYLTGGEGGLQRRRGVLKRGGVGGEASSTHPYVYPYSNFPKYPLSCSLADANLFAVITESSVSVIDL